MVTLLYIISISVIVLMSLESLIRIFIQISYNRLDVLYDEMEMFILKNNIKLGKDLLFYIRGYKRIKQNKEFADIKILLLMKQIIPNGEFAKSKESFDKISANMDPKLKAIAETFDQEVAKTVLLSAFKVDFLLFSIYKAIKLVLIANFR